MWHSQPHQGVVSVLRVPQFPVIQAFHEVFLQACSPSLLPWRFSPFLGDMGDGMVGFPNSGGVGPRCHCAQGDKIPKSHG